MRVTRCVQSTPRAAAFYACCPLRPRRRPEKSRSNSRTPLPHLRPPPLHQPQHSRSPPPPSPPPCHPPPLPLPPPPLFPDHYPQISTGLSPVGPVPPVALMVRQSLSP